MSKLDELIKELCPNGVEFKKLGELGTIYNGLTGKNKNDFLEGNKRYITYVNVFNNISIDIGSQDKVKIDENEKQNKVEYGDIIFTASSENIEDVGMTSVLTSIIEEDLYLNSFCFGFRFKNNIMSPSFSKYLFRSENLRKQIRKTANGVTRFNISKEKIKEILIPILPLKIQEEIVRILDDYTKSVEELKEKLNSEFIAREKQYEFYRNLLLTFETENNSLSKTRQDKTRQDINKLFMCNFRNIKLELAEVFELKNGYTPSKSISEYWKNGDINWFKIEDINTNGRVLNNSIEKVNKKGIKGKLFPKNTLIISTSATIGEYALITKEFLCNQRFTCLITKEEYKDVVLPMFLKHYAYILSKKCRENIKVGNFPSVDMNKFKKIPILLPPLEVQKRIVEVLDNFEKICNDLNIDLPAEIEARQKQYEFYRNFLLTFKEDSVNSLRQDKTRQDKTRQDKIRYI
ncbi:restriction endonuclease subunit S [Fusobacterium hwasookii]|uniref:restriction endonuclease subunit S n=2 Tax=Fusobacterium hwasookii TaxID=1583098 RepID=UPI0009C02C80|nr:restriction endonuclease subunit S [Fusobacterium hwasookii]